MRLSSITESILSKFKKKPNRLHNEDLDEYKYIEDEVGTDKFKQGVERWGNYPDKAEQNHNEESRAHGEEEYEEENFTSHVSRGDLYGRQDDEVEETSDYQEEHPDEGIVNGDLKEEENKSTIEARDGDGEVKINYGGGLLNTSKRDKKDVYKDMKNRVTDEEMVTIDRLLKESASAYELYEKLEEEHVPLMLLVALGFVAEEDIIGYHAYKGRGFDGEDIQEMSGTGGAELSYEEEIMRMRVSIPEYVNNPVETVGGGGFVPPTVDGDGVGVVGGIQEDNTEPVHIEAGGGTLHIEASNQPVHIEMAEEVKEVKKSDGGGEVWVAGTGTRLVDEESGDALERLTRLNSIRHSEPKSVIVDELVEEPNIEKDSTEHFENHGKANYVNDRDVYVIYEGVKLPELEGYRIHEVSTYEGVQLYSSSKENLLVVTTKIPGAVLESFGDWLVGIMEDGDKQRMVTLEGLSVVHPNIEKTIELTKEGLDEYFSEYPDSKYSEIDTTGTFTDFGDIFG